MDKLNGLHIHITGIVQGVGFRPFVYGLAQRSGITGWVKNTSAGVDIQAEGTPEQLAAFLQGLATEAPPLAHIDSITNHSIPLNGFTSFEIIHSEAIAAEFQPISPDVAICDDCLHELFEPTDRRYLYPFTNCTNCGPRFTIITDIPYDRPNTTMAGFPLCEACASEYHDPTNRRFHAQPVACPVCGPQIWLETSHEDPPSEVVDDSMSALQTARQWLREGKILAIKGLGGFHLACDATNSQAVNELRRRKLRVDKAFALMMADLHMVQNYCQVNETEQELVTSRQRPIVILQRKTGATAIAEAVAPGQATLGVMLPYTPLHYLLFRDGMPPLVMTSGNLSEEPIAIDNQEARQRLADLTDAFLMHDRPIRTRCDDSVMRVYQGIYPLRRSRGYAPFPVRLPWQSPDLLAGGAELKNTFCLARGQYAFLSHHIGDLENYETLRSFMDGIEHFQRLFRIRPQWLAYDLHPNYLSSRYILERASTENIPAVGVQHHHAHIAACMLEHQAPAGQAVIGVAFDGTGYGEDGAIWGGEFLLAGYTSYLRLAHLEYLPLPGGDTAVRKPARIALAYLWKTGFDWDLALPCTTALCAEERTIIRSQLEHQVNTIATSSMGRLFDAVAAIVGIRQQVNYEAQAAIELEALADPEETEAYSFYIPKINSTQTVEIGIKPALEAILSDLYTNIPRPRISARFHNGLARLVIEMCQAIRKQHGINQVALSGGVWQNLTLLDKTVNGLQAAGFEVMVHRLAPTNDGGIALGQAAVAFHKITGGV